MVRIARRLGLWAAAAVAGLAQAADYTQGVSVAGNVATLWFKSNVNTSWVDVHYQVNGGTQQNCACPTGPPARATSSR